MRSPCAAFLFLAALVTASAQDRVDDTATLIRKATAELLALQEENGGWAYEGVYRVDGKIPVAYRAGGTALVAGALLAADPDAEKTKRALDRGLAYLLSLLDDPLLEASTEDLYDVRIWGHATVLEYFCRARDAKALGDRAKAVETWIPKLVRTLLTEELPQGGWNYAGRRQPASFVTAPVAQALLCARGQGFEVPREVLDRARKVLEDARSDSGAFLYAGQFKEDEARYTSDQLEGSCARSAACETTLRLLGSGSVAAVQGALDAFHAHWGELEKRRKKTGTHEGPYKIAPYYFYYGHRYAGQAIQMLPETQRTRERERLLKVVMKTRDADGTWNDRVFDRSRAYGTAMIVMALLGDHAPLPPALTK